MCVIVVALITIIDVFPVIGGVGRIAGVIFGSILILKEWAPVSILDLEAAGIAACKEMHAIDYVLWEG